MPEVSTQPITQPTLVDRPRYTAADVVRYLRLPQPASPVVLAGNPPVWPDWSQGGDSAFVPAGVVAGRGAEPAKGFFSFAQLVSIFLAVPRYPRGFWVSLDPTLGRHAWFGVVYGDHKTYSEDANLAGTPEVIQGEREAYRDRVEFDSDGRPTRLYPFVKQDRGRDAPRPIAIDPGYGFGNPILAGSYLRVDVIASRFRGGESVCELAEDYDIPSSEVEEAIRYESGYVA